MLEDRDGRRWLRNAIDALDHKLIERETLKTLLLEIEAEWRDMKPQKWPEAMVNVCTGQRQRPGAARARFTLVGPSVPIDGHSAGEWSYLITGDAWLTHHVDTSKPSASPWPSFPLNHDASALSDFRQFVEREDWFVPASETAGAWLGRPAAQGATCWVSTSEMDTAVDAPRSHTHGTSREVGWALGLDHTPDEARIRYRIDAAAVRGAKRVDGRRPTPTDLPNRWFRTKVSGSRGKHYNRHGWGATVDLHAVWDDRAITDGRPEQVLPSIELSDRNVKGIDCILPSEDDKEFSDPHLKFDDLLHKRRTPSEIKKQIRSRIESLYRTRNRRAT
ncbi:hypothetical protein [Pseudorhodoferax sp. Leaf265]|uniref:hypothetical protein n=1 Tax=Pseudorhodoferax sp. Leaf265 TaxID=1736315 RepID=UPI0012E82038|nr:hypothetical protein [Pseudorhodoferax sp. Leaf265]